MWKIIANEHAQFYHDYYWHNQPEVKIQTCDSNIIPAVY